MGIVDGWPLEVEDESPRALRKAIQMLLDIEAIRRVKHAYFRCIDTGNFAEVETLLAPDVKVHFIGGTYEWVLNGRDEYMKAMQSSFHTQSVGHHNGHHPEIQILSADEATGIWYLADNMWVMNRKNFATGTALYWDRYKKIDGKWLISDTKYERIYELNTYMPTPPKFFSNYLAKYGQDLPEK